MLTAENFKFSSAKFKFDGEAATVFVYPRMATNAHTFCIQVYCRRFDEQVSSVAQIFDFLSPVFSEVDHLTLTLDYYSHSLSKWHHEAGRSQWRKLFRSFNNVKNLCVDSDNLSDSELSRFLSQGGLLEGKRTAGREE